MKFTFSWLKKYLLTHNSLAEITNKLTEIGLEVESVDDFSRYEPFLVAEIIATEKHPEADKLQLVTLNVGKSEPIKLVCGAKNARKGIKVVYAPAGTYIPGLDITLSVVKIRGVESCGMLCSLKELNLGEDDGGIIELPEESVIGSKFADYAKLIDPLIEIGLTPNRADCTGVYGIARDLAAAGMGQLLPLAEEVVKGDFSVNLSIKVEQDENACLAFTYRKINNIKNNDSPEWMQRYLRVIGQRNLSAVVDVTNYFTFDIGRPLHVFDADKIKGNLVIRRAKEGEEFIALDNNIYQLTSNDTVICDEEGIISLAGIIGGLRTACDRDTRSIILESALWDSQMIAITGRRLGISTDARYRFERGVDAALVGFGLDAASAIILEFCGGTASNKTEIWIQSKEKLTDRELINFDLNEVKRLLGIDVDPAEIEKYFLALGFKLEKQEEFWQIVPPSWRYDIQNTADLVEEIMRLYGVDNIKSQPLDCSGNYKLSSEINLARSLAALGLMENVNYSFISAKYAELFGGGADELKLLNPISADMSDMRPSLLPGMLVNMQKNIDRGYNNLAFFEIGDIYLSTEAKGQLKMAATVRQGKENLTSSERLWNNDIKDVTLYDAKIDAFTIIASLGLQSDSVQIDANPPSYYHPGRAGVLKLGAKNTIGYFGELHPEIISEMGLSGAVCACEIFLDNIPQTKIKSSKTKPRLTLHNLQPVVRDFSFILPVETPSINLVRSVKGADKKFIKEVKIFDVFQGGNLTIDTKAVGIEVTLQPVEKSFTDADIEEISNKIIAAVNKHTGAILRS
ncbi:phenylalanine--tRNA ligase subunit beta [Bartonella sp. DGB1]|uniref:phenylalanine--tRNA ligase subunit beta n=1 Tax=Bartonella sp. DGB1 TaxID=3239807 RepID=UPI00352320A8